MNPAEAETPTPCDLARLPCLPQALLKLLEACENGTEQARSASLEWILSDPAVCLRFLDLSPDRSASLEQRLHSWPLPSLRAVAHDLALRQLALPPDPVRQRLARQLWRDAMHAAFSARRLAQALGAAPQEAFLSVLAQSSGALVLAATAPARYAAWLASADDATQLRLRERESFGTDHDDLTLQLLGRWQLPAVICDAVRHRSAAVAQLHDTHVLTRIGYAAHHWTVSGTVLAAPLAQLLDLDARAFDGATTAAATDLKNLAEVLGLGGVAGTAAWPAAEDPAHAAKLLEHLQAQSLHAALATLPPAEAAHLLRTGLQLRFGLGPAQVLLVDDDGQYLRGGAQSLRCGPGRNLAADALHERRPLRVEAATGRVADQQLVAALGAPALVCLPLLAGDRGVGVIVAGAAREAAHKALSDPQLAAYVSAAASALAGDAPAGRRSAVQLLREAVHETAAPLTAIRNYLYLLGEKVGDNGREDLRVLREETERVGRILRGLAEGPAATAEATVVDLNALVTERLRLFEAARFTGSSLRTQADLDPTLPRLALDAGALKQILTNLMDNAREAMPAGGVLTLSSRDGVNLGGALFVALVVSDTGPGIAAARLARLFAPMSSSKPGHTGLGLAIVHRLVTQMGGQISCRSQVGAGTAFQILLPRRLPPAATGVTPAQYSSESAA